MRWIGSWALVLSILIATMLLRQRVTRGFLRITVTHRLRGVQLFSASTKTTQKSDTKRSAFLDIKPMIEAVRNEDFSAALKIYNKRDTTVSWETVPRLMLIFLSAFHKADHLPVLLEIVNEIRAHNLKLPEVAYIALIRCYCAANETKTAWRYFEELQHLGLPMKVLRLYQPFLEAYERKLDVGQQLIIIDSVFRHRLGPRPEHIATILRTFVTLRRKDPEKASKFSERVRDMLVATKDKVSGLNGDELTLLAAAADNLSVSEIEAMGLLVHSTDGIEKAIISADNLTIDGSVVAYNISYQPQRSPVMQSESLPFPRSAESHTPPGLRDYDRLQFLPERFVVQTMRKRMLSVNSDNDSYRNSSNNDDGEILPSIQTENLEAGTSQASEPKLNLSPELRARIQSEMRLAARQVFLPADSNICPHCQGSVINVPLTEEEKLEIRTALYSIGANLPTPGVEAALKTFENFLQSQTHEFDYVIDGANVAYHKQNHIYGRFSYGQIRLVVEELQRIGKRVLVILPSVYSVNRSVIPITPDRPLARSLPLKENEKEFLRELNNQRLLFTVPRGINDDLFWMLAIVYEGRKQACQVITNDMMRDHALATLAFSAFNRMRTSSVVYFSIDSDLTSLDTSHVTSLHSQQNNLFNFTGNHSNSFSMLSEGNPRTHGKSLPPMSQNNQTATRTNTEMNSSSHSTNVSANNNPRDLRSTLARFLVNTPTSSSSPASSFYAKPSLASAAMMIGVSRNETEKLAAYKSSTQTVKKAGNTSTGGVLRSALSNPYITFLDDAAFELMTELRIQQERDDAQEPEPEPELEPELEESLVAFGSDTDEDTNSDSSDINSGSERNNHSDSDGDNEKFSDVASTIASTASSNSTSKTSARLELTPLGRNVSNKTTKMSQIQLQELEQQKLLRQQYFQQERPERRKQNEQTSSPGASRLPFVRSSSKNNNRKGDERSKKTINLKIKAKNTQESDPSPTEEANAEDIGEFARNELLRSNAYSSILSRDDLMLKATVNFYQPSNSSRDIQEDIHSQTWHIPALDKMKWLCLKLGVENKDEIKNKEHSE